MNSPYMGTLIITVLLLGLHTVAASSDARFLTSSHNRLWSHDSTAKAEEHGASFAVAAPSADKKASPVRDEKAAGEKKLATEKKEQAEAGEKDLIDLEKAEKQLKEVQKYTPKIFSGPDAPSTKQYEAAQTNEHASKYPIIHAMHLRLEMILGKNTDIWWMDWKLWVGLTCWCAVWAKWLIIGYSDIYHFRAIFSFGINITILHILQFTSSIRVGMLWVCVILCGQALFANMIWFKSEGKHSEGVMTEFDCDTLYLNLSLPPEQIVVLFVAQLGVWWFYMTSILGNFDFDHVNYLFWLWSYLAMQMTMIFCRGADSVLGSEFPIHDVYRLVLSAGTVEYTVQDGKAEIPFKLSKPNMIMRGVMGFFCNSILREIMAYTIPLMLMGFSEPMDFVVYCVGVNFICTLDDMSARKFSIAAAAESPE